MKGILHFSGRMELKKVEEMLCVMRHDLAVNAQNTRLTFSLGFARECAISVRGNPNADALKFYYEKNVTFNT